MTKEELYHQLSAAAERAYKRGIQVGNGGNISARNPEGGMIVKSSGGSFADCNGDGKGFVLTDLDGNVLGNQNIKPTREVFLHGFLYKLNPNIGGIVHTHSPNAISWAYTNGILPMVTQHAKLKLKYDIPILNIDSPIVRPEDGSDIKKLFENNGDLTAFILAGHGIVAVGENPLSAEHTAELVEETAQIAIKKYLLEHIK